MNIGDAVTIAPHCTLWPGRPGVVQRFRDPAPGDKELLSTIGVRAEKADGCYDSSWFAPTELVSHANSFLMVGLIDSINDLIHAEKGCDHDDDSTLRSVEFIGDGGLGEDHQVCKVCDKVTCCPGVAAKYPRARA